VSSRGEGGIADLSGAGEWSKAKVERLDKGVKEGRNEWLSENLIELTAAVFVEVAMQRCEIG